MKFKLLAVFLLPLLMSMGAFQAQAQIQTEQPAPAPGALPIDAYGRLPSLEMMRVSPDGSKVAYVKAFKEGRMLMVVARGSPAKALRGIRVDREKLRGISWIDDDHVMVTASTAGYARGVESAKREWWQSTSFEVSTGRQTVFLDSQPDDAADAMNTLSGPPMVRRLKGETVVFLPGISFVDHRGVSTLFRTDAAGRSTRMAVVGDENTQAWFVSGDGETIVREGYDEHQRKWTLDIKTPEHGFRERISLIAPIETPQVLGFEETGKTLILSWGSTETEADDEQGVALYRLDVEGAAPLEKWREQTFDIPIHDPQTHALIGGQLGGFQMGDLFFNAHDQAQWDAIAKAYSGEGVELESWSADRKVIIARTEGPLSGASYSLIDLHTGHANYQGDMYSGMGPNEMGEVRQITYVAGDGFKVPALLTLPPGFKGKPDPKNLPLVVLPHGGPAASDRVGFDWWSQALAAQGWAVLQPQFRGSGGFGNAHMQAGFGEFGKKMQSDLSDGVRYLASSGLVDPKRAAITGASYGGYAALAAAAFDGATYRCAVSVSGIGDLRAFLHWLADREEDRKTSTERYWNRFMGSKSMDDPVLDAISPIKHVDAIRVPILLIHSKDDTVVDYAQSVHMREALSAAGKSVELVTLNREDHWLSHPDTRTQMLTESIRFLKACNPPN